MRLQHRELTAGGWRRLSFVEQMANTGSEVERALNWQAKGHAAYCQKAFERALELLDLSLETAVKPSYLKELARLREALADYFAGSNEFASTPDLWRKYFSVFTYAARKDV